FDPANAGMRSFALRRDSKASPRTFTGWIAPACGWRTDSITSSARASITRFDRLLQRHGTGRRPVAAVAVDVIFQVARQVPAGLREQALSVSGDRRPRYAQEGVRSGRSQPTGNSGPGDRRVSNRNGNRTGALSLRLDAIENVGDHGAVADHAPYG